MALNMSKVVPDSPVLAKRVNGSRSQRVLLAFSSRNGSSAEELQSLCCTKPVTSRRSSTLCFLGKSQDTETKPHEDYLDLPNSQIVKKEGDKQLMPRRKSNSSQVLVEYVSNDAKFVNERARSYFVLLSRGIMRLDARARQDVAILGSWFLKLDAQAREDTEKIDRDVKRKAERLHHIAVIVKDIAQSKLKNAADKHWSDVALEPSPHFTPFHNPDPPLEAVDSIFTLSIHSSRRIRRDVILSVSATLIPQLFFYDRKRSSSANAADIFNFIAPQPEPERTVEIAQEGLRKNAENIKEIKEMMLKSKRWKEGGKELRRSASNMKQDMYLIIQAKPPKDRPLLRTLYSSLFNTITKLDYAARDGDATKVMEYYKSIDAIFDNIFSRI